MPKLLSNVRVTPTLQVSRGIAHKPVNQTALAGIHLLVIVYFLRLGEMAVALLAGDRERDVPSGQPLASHLLITGNDSSSMCPAISHKQRCRHTAKQPYQPIRNPTIQYFNGFRGYFSL